MTDVIPSSPTMCRTENASEMPIPSSNRSTFPRLRRQRSPSPSDQLHQERRQRSERHSGYTSQAEDETQSTSGSSTTSVSPFYGLGDDYAVNNLFASSPQTFSSLPRPHSSQCFLGPVWALRSEHEIYLQNDFFRGKSRRLPQRVTARIPGPQLDASDSEPPESASSVPQHPTRSITEFESALR